MRVLLSLCNQQRTPDKGALIFDFATKSGSWLGLGTQSEIMGTRGICLDGRYAYVAYTVGWYETHISVYEIGGEAPTLLADYLLPEVKDPHSICLHDGRLLAASTGTDEIIAYDLSGPEVTDLAETLWRASNAGEDTHHINSVASDGNRVIISAFGPRPGEFWSSAQSGYLLDVGAQQILCEQLRHPHSVRIFAGEVYFTESSRQTLMRMGSKPIVIGGYVRGCEVVDAGTILAGSNVARRVSRSQGIVLNDSNPENVEGEAVGKCSLVCVMPQGPVMREFFDVTSYGSEIYDIRLLP